MKQSNFVVHVVDPDPAIADALKALLDTYDMEVDYYPNAKSFLRDCDCACKENCCLLAEADMPGLSGPAMLRQLSDKCVDVPILLLVSTASPQLMEAAKRSTRICVIEKPIVSSVLIDELLRLKQLA